MLDAWSSNTGRRRALFYKFCGDGEASAGAEGFGSDFEAGGGLDIPVLYLVGENEKIYSPDEAVRRLKNVAPQVRTVFVPDCGHDLIFVKTATVNEAVLEFLDE